MKGMLYDSLTYAGHAVRLMFLLGFTVVMYRTFSNNGFWWLLFAVHSLWGVAAVALCPFFDAWFPMSLTYALAFAIWSRPAWPCVCDFWASSSSPKSLGAAKGV